MTTLVFTIIGDDRPGLVEEIARIVNEHEANWLGSRMSRLGGKFAGMIQVEGAPEHAGALRQALSELSGVGLEVTAQEGVEETAPAARTLSVTMLGLDRPGIVREVSKALAARSLNVLDLATDITQAAMTGRAMFNGTAIVAVTDALDVAELSAELDVISRELGVDIEIVED